MLNLVILGLIITLQIIPSAIVDLLGDDLQWQLWHVSMLSIVILQALYIYRSHTFNDKAQKLLAVIMLILATWFFIEYFSITEKSRPTPVITQEEDQGHDL